MAELLVPIEIPDVESFASICARILSADDVDSSRKIAWESLSPLMLYNARYSVSEQLMNKLECVRTYVGMTPSAAIETTLASNFLAFDQAKAMAESQRSYKSTVAAAPIPLVNKVPAKVVVAPVVVAPVASSAAAAVESKPESDGYSSSGGYSSSTDTKLAVPVVEAGASANQGGNITEWSVRIRMALPAQSVEQVVEACSLQSLRDMIDIVPYNFTEESCPTPPGVLYVDYADFSHLQSLYWTRRIEAHQKQRASTAKVLPDLIYAVELKNLKASDFKLRKLGSGNFGDVFGCDLAVFKVYRDPAYLAKIKACSSQLSSFGLNARMFASGYISENIMTHPCETNWFEMWTLNVQKGTFHCDLKPDNVLNGSLIDLDNYFFQACGHREWVMSDTRYYPLALQKRGPFFADWTNIQAIAHYPYSIMFWFDSWDMFILKSGRLTNADLLMIDRASHSNRWRRFNAELISNSEPGIFKMTRHVFEINYEAPHDCCLTHLHCKDSPFAKAKNTNLELRNRDLFKRNVELIDSCSHKTEPGAVEPIPVAYFSDDKIATVSRRSYNSYSVKVGDVKVLRDKNEVHVEVQSSGDMSQGALTLPECVLVTPDSIAVLAVRFEQSLATDRAIKGHAVFSTEHLQLGLRHRFFYAVIDYPSYVTVQL